MNRTLEGHLGEDDLDEVVRSVALSRRSGVLCVDAPEGSAEIRFVRGRIVSARLSDSGDTIAQLLLRAGVLESADLPEKAGRDAPTLDEVLRSAASRRPDGPDLIAQANTVLTGHLRAAVVRVLMLPAGRFAFRASEDEAPPPRYPRDTGFTLPEGVDGEELAREARRRRLDSREAPLEHDGERRNGEGANGPELVLVSCDDVYTSRAQRKAGSLGLTPRALPHARAALEALDQPDEGRERYFLVDLVMPRSTGRGVLGGLEVLRRAKERGLADRVYLTAALPHEDATERILELGGGGLLLRSPSVGGAPPRFATLLNPILERLGRSLLVDEPADLIDQLREELNEFEEEWSSDSPLLDEDTKSLEVLKSLLIEVNDPSFEEEIPLLVLRFASAFFSRGALFHLAPHSRHIVGLGGYGMGPGDPGRTIRSVRIPVEADTVFLRCMRERNGVRQPFFDSEWNSHLLDALGGPRPHEVYTAPLRSPRGIEALVYADNALDDRPFPDIALLEIFLQQAGAALERWSLKRQLEELSRPLVPGAA